MVLPKLKNRFKYLERAGNLHKPDISTYCFPLQTEDDIERLESEVKNNCKLRNQYINFLQQVKTPSIEIGEIFKKIFYDEALANYNYNGFCNSRMVKKRAMKDYCIFVDCLLAWRDHGITQDEIRTTLRKIVKNVHNRKRFRRYKNKIRDRKTGESSLYLEPDF
ncbi:uncharacterized protein LOC131432885 [Malaya genurostris]|uniref:uncharacterized protein LOC131432885 n=1 Tax=Malaya genurostris TaxID=325434 RepID=UPI0026F3941E|nr:uncharacterized protein LOC131432885 [Malaya genurostris]